MVTFGVCIVMSESEQFKNSKLTIWDFMSVVWFIKLVEVEAIESHE